LIKSSSIQAVLDAAVTAEVVEEYVQLKRRGANLLGLCPFHNEKTPSFTVSPSKNIYKCFGCGKGGGAVQFVMEHEQMSFIEAIRFLAKKYSIELQEEAVNDDKWAETRKHIESLNIINQFALEFYHDLLWNSDKGKAVGLSYFKERGFLEKTIKDFELGFAPIERDVFTKAALEKGFKIEYLKELGLTNQSGYDFFRDRIIFPIHNSSGRPIAFSGRILSSNKKIAKYINSPESEVYLKRKILYALNLAKKSIRKEDNVFMVEGYSDVISLHQSGITNVVASSGTSLTDEQILQIKRLNVDNITLLFDGDQAGVKATLRAIDLILQKDMNPYVVALPETDDPDSFVKNHGYQGFLDYVELNRKDFLDYKSDLLLSRAGDDPIKKAEAIREIVNSIAHISYHVKRDLYVQKCALKFKLDENRLIRDVDKELKQLQKQQAGRQRYERRDSFPSEEPPRPSIADQVATDESYSSTDLFQEKDLARLCILFGSKIVKDEENEYSVSEFIHAQIEDVLIYFEHELYKKIILESFELVSNDRQIDLSKHFLQHDNDKIQEFAITVSSSPYEYADWEERGVILQTQVKPEENFYTSSLQSVLHFKFRKLKHVIVQIKERLAIENNEDQKILLLKAFQKLQEQKVELAKELNLVIS
jgi:DNA primase